jgi:hypothetical protein
MYGFMPSRTPVCSPLTHPHIASRDRSLVALFNKLTMPCGQIYNLIPGRYPPSVEASGLPPHGETLL